MRVFLECSPTYSVYDRYTGNRYPVPKELHDVLDEFLRDIEAELEFTEECDGSCLSA
jgi:hypothetical protein